MSDLVHEHQAVELPLIEQLKGMGWQHLDGQTGLPYLTEHQSFRVVRLTRRLHASIRSLNLDENGQHWLDKRCVTETTVAIEPRGAPRLMGPILIALLGPHVMTRERWWANITGLSSHEELAVPTQETGGK